MSNSGRRAGGISDGLYVAISLLVIVGSVWAAVVLYGSALRSARSLGRIAASIERIERAGVVTVKTTHVHNTYKGLPDNEVARGISNGR